MNDLRFGAVKPNAAAAPIHLWGRRRAGVDFMEQKTFFEHYRICVRDDGSPQELGQTALCTIYKGVDTRSGDSVAIKLIPIASLDEQTREQFEEQGRSAQALDHINIAKIHAFGAEGDQFVYVGEHLEGETTEAWVATHGPMTPDVVLRIALQVVSALGVATFHKLTHRAIQPSNLVIVPGPTAEGDWPLVKLINPGFAATPTTNGATTETETSNFLQFASPEQLQHAPVDFRSEIYSLGCTMCFLLTGSAPFSPSVIAAQRLSTPPRLKQLRRLPKSIRNLIGHMLRDNPDERPQDPVALADYMRDCLAGLDRRQTFARRLGLPPIAAKWAAVAAAIEKPRRPLPMKGLAIAAAIVLLIGLGTMTAVLLPKNLTALWHRESKPIGVPVGVPENPPAVTAQNVARAPAQTAAPSLVANAVNASPVQAPPPVFNESVASSSPAAQATSTPIVTAQSPEPRPPAQGPQTVWEREAGRTIHEAPAAQTPETGDNEEATNDSQTTAARKSQTASVPEAASKTETNTTTSAKRRTASARSTRPRVTTSRVETGLPPLPAGSFRAEFLGTTPDGRLIFGMPNGEVKYLRPRAHRFRHYPIERREPGFQAPYQPYDN